MNRDYRVPALAAGDYTLQGQAAFGQNDVRPDILKATLTVA